MPTGTPNRLKPAASTHLPKRQRVWTSARKLMGNLIPGLIALPTAIVGITFMVTRAEIIGRGFWMFCTSPLLGWLAMNWFGLNGNEAMKKEIALRLKAARPKLADPCMFVGIATPKYASLLDPHEDVGYLILYPERLEFYGDNINLSVDKRDISSIVFRANPHTLVGLGRWISIEGRVSEQPIRLQVELRERRTLMGNMMLSGSLKHRLVEWLRQ
jgi:hypothetical protein